jgi:hypothetical protein
MLYAASGYVNGSVSEKSGEEIRVDTVGIATFLRACPKEVTCCMGWGISA